MKHGYFDWSSVTASPQPAQTFFHDNGYVVLTNFCTQQQTQTLRDRAAQLLDDFYTNPSSPASIFSTKDQTRPQTDAYFLSSASNISCFLEEKQLPGDKPAVNKIGHALHDLDDAFCSFSRQDSVRRACELLGARRPALVQSMYILKNARVGGEVSAHRDATFVRGADGACLGLWWPLERATERNGCLWAVPGSHRDARERRRLVRSGDALRMEGNPHAEKGYDGYVPLPVEAGDLVMLHGELVHASAENVSENSRHAYSVHVVERDIAPDCWLQRLPHLPFRPL